MHANLGFNNNSNISKMSKIKNCHRVSLSQTYSAYEIIIMDDGSDDGTKEMVNLFKDSRIYNWQSNSGIPAKVRNNGIKLPKENGLL